MLYLGYIFALTSALNIGDGKTIKYLSNFKFEDIVYGEEEVIKDFVTLANDPKANLPDSYTICSSVFVQFVTTDKIVIEMLKHDGSPWYLFELSATDRKYDSLTEVMTIWYADPVTGKTVLEYFSNTNIPIVPHSWYHICMGLDTVSGLLRIVVNGVEVVDEEKEYFKNTQTWKPNSLEQKILVFKGYVSGMWYQHRSTFSNLNIFGRMMTVEDMVTRTSGGETCTSPGDYLRFAILDIYTFTAM